MRQQITAPLSAYPFVQRLSAAFLGADAPAAVTSLGDVALLDRQPLAIFCSLHCPGSLIVQASDLAHALRDAGAAVIGGFHTPVEHACLEILLTGSGPLIVCPARGMYKTIPAELRKPLADGRLLLLSPFDEAERRVTAELAATRNRFVAALADRVLFIHAAPGGRTEALAREVIGWGKLIYTPDHSANSHVSALGATPMQANGAGWSRTSGSCPISDEVE
jgi:predicted Rossmann fold nucleotide-binding protein DprA/Smf involved in DNA uptake